MRSFLWFVPQPALRVGVIVGVLCLAEVAVCMSGARADALWWYAPDGTEWVSNGIEYTETLRSVTQGGGVSEDVSGIWVTAAAEFYGLANEDGEHSEIQGTAVHSFTVYEPDQMRAWPIPVVVKVGGVTAPGGVGTDGWPPSKALSSIFETHTGGEDADVLIETSGAEQKAASVMDADNTGSGTPPTTVYNDSAATEFVTPPGTYARLTPVPFAVTANFIAWAICGNPVDPGAEPVQGVEATGWGSQSTAVACGGAVTSFPGPATFVLLPGQ